MKYTFPVENYPAGSRCRRETRVYDRDGRLTQKSIYPGSCGSDELRLDYTYAQDGSRTIEDQMILGKDSPPPPPPPAPPPASAGSNTEAGGDGKPRTVFEFDAPGKLIEDTSVTPSGRVLYEQMYSYDAKGRMVEITGYEGGRVTHRRVYSYTGDDRVPSGYASYGRGGSLSARIAYTEYEFNSRGDWVKRKETIEERKYSGRTIKQAFREVEYYPDGR